MADLILSAGKRVTLYMIPAHAPESMSSYVAKSPLVNALPDPSAVGLAAFRDA